MVNSLNLKHTANWVFGTFVFVIGLLNLFLIHPVPGIAYILLSFIYLPPASDLLKQKFDFSISAFIKIIFGIIIFLFTIGVSDLGDMLDKWLK
jgi:hypothetical protein